MTEVNVIEQLAAQEGYDLVVILVRGKQVGSILPVLAANKFTPKDRCGRERTKSSGTK